MGFQVLQGSGGKSTTVTIPTASVGTEGLVPLAANGGTTAGTVVQANDSRLLSVPTGPTTGIIARTGSGTAAARTITAGSNQVSVADGDGISGNPTIDVEPGFVSAAYWNPRMWTDGASLLGTVAVTPPGSPAYVIFGLNSLPVARVTSTTTTTSVLRTTNAIACLAQAVTHRFSFVTGPVKTLVEWRVGLALAPMGNALKPANVAVMLAFDTDSGEANAATNWYGIVYDGSGGAVNYLDTGVVCNVDTAYEAEIIAQATQVYMRIRPAGASAWSGTVLATAQLPASTTGMQPSISCRSTSAATTRNIDFRAYSGWKAY